MTELAATLLEEASYVQALRHHASANSLIELHRRLQEHTKLRVLITPRWATFERNASFQSRLKAAVHSQLSSEIRLMGLPYKVTVVVEVERERSAAEKQKYRRMDFPIYAMEATAKAADLHELIREHDIPADYRGENIYHRVQTSWTRRDYGVAAPPSPENGSFAKAGFLRFERIAKDCTGDLVQCTANVLLHELMHMLGSTKHSTRGLMQRPNLRAWGVPVSLDATSRGQVAHALLALIRSAVESR